MSLRPVSISESSEREIEVASATCASESPRDFRAWRSAMPSAASSEWPAAGGLSSTGSMLYSLVPFRRFEQEKFP